MVIKISCGLNFDFFGIGNPLLTNEERNTRVCRMGQWTTEALIICLSKMTFILVWWIHIAQLTLKCIKSKWKRNCLIKFFSVSMHKEEQWLKVKNGYLLKLLSESSELHNGKLYLKTVKRWQDTKTRQYLTLSLCFKPWLQHTGFRVIQKSTR